MLFLLGISTVQQAPPPVKPQVMILGSYHMDNPGLDLVKVKIRDTMSAERQKEIQDLVARLVKFKPTKIAVEADFDNKKIPAAYADYLRGQHELTASEVEQVGFRVAKDLGHPKVYCIDYSLDMDFGKLSMFAGEHKQQWFLDRLQTAATVMSAKLEEMDRRFTVGQILAIHNSPDVVRYGHSIYLEMLKLNVGAAYPGADVVADWYKRNMVIFANVRRIIDSPSDRVLVLYGSGHAKLLRDFVEDSVDLELVEPNKYLPKPPRFDLRF